MKYKGRVYENIDLDEYDYDVSEAIVTDTKISMDWSEDDVTYYLKASSTDGTNYTGNYGSPRPNSQWHMKLTRYTAQDGSELLLGDWNESDSGQTGRSVFELDPE